MAVVVQRETPHPANPIALTAFGSAETVLTIFSAI